MEGKPAATTRVLLVGHCGPDAYAIKNAVSRSLPGAAVSMVTSDADLARELPTANLLLINRMLDGDYSADSGIDLIRTIASTDGPKPAMMLISNYNDAQQDALAAGALPGFGKRDLYTPLATDRLRAAAGA